VRSSNSTFELAMCYSILRTFESINHRIYLPLRIFTVVWLVQAYRGSISVHGAGPNDDSSSFTIKWNEIKSHKAHSTTIIYVRRGECKRPSDIELRITTILRSLTLNSLWLPIRTLANSKRSRLTLPKYIQSSHNVTKRRCRCRIRHN
jgi:hypothetical protein